MLYVQCMSKIELWQMTRISDAAYLRMGGHEVRHWYRFYSNRVHIFPNCLLSPLVEFTALLLLVINYGLPIYVDS